MRLFKLVLDFYLRASIHVGLSVWALCMLTGHMFGISEIFTPALFGFFVTVAGYNFVKFHTLFLSRRSLSNEALGILLVSAVAAAGGAYCFFRLDFAAQLAGILSLLLTVLYTLPFFPNRKNFRNWAGVKIYIVSFCWVVITVVMPVLDAGIPIGNDFWLKCAQRFILVFVLILAFEITDLGNDDPLLETVPQKLGVTATKNLGLFLLTIFYILEFFRVSVETAQLLANLFLITITGAMLWFAQPWRSRYYASFWVESIPIVWWLILILMV